MATDSTVMVPHLSTVPESLRRNRIFTGYVTSVEKAEIIKKSYEEKTESTFITWFRNKSFGNTDWTHRRHQTQWEIYSPKDGVLLPFMGIPFYIVGKITYDCQYGKDRNVKKKATYFEGKQRQRFRAVNSKKRNCPAQITMKEVVLFPEFKISKNSKFRKESASAALRKKIIETGAAAIKTEKRIYIYLPNPSLHANHIVDEVNEVQEQKKIDSAVIKKEITEEGTIPIKAENLIDVNFLQDLDHEASHITVEINESIRRLPPALKVERSFRDEDIVRTARHKCLHFSNSNKEKSSAFNVSDISRKRKEGAALVFREEVSNKRAPSTKTAKCIYIHLVEPSQHVGVVERNSEKRRALGPIAITKEVPEHETAAIKMEDFILIDIPGPGQHKDQTMEEECFDFEMKMLPVQCQKPSFLGAGIVDVVVPAGGRGERMGGGDPKQYTQVCGIPLVTHCLKAFESVPWIRRVMVAADDETRMESVVCAAGLSRTYVVKGEKTRHRSIWAGLKALEVLQFSEQPPAEPWIVVVHDGVRPLVPCEVLVQVVEGAVLHGAAGPVRQLVSTVIVPDDQGLLQETLVRDLYRNSEMPQAFKFELLKKAYNSCSDDELDHGTECLALVKQHTHVRAALIPGTDHLWKVTHQYDLVKAESFIPKYMHRLAIVLNHDMCPLRTDPKDPHPLPHQLMPTESPQVVGERYGASEGGYNCNNSCAGCDINVLGEYLRNSLQNSVKQVVVFCDRFDPLLGNEVFHRVLVLQGYSHHHPYSLPSASISTVSTPIHDNCPKTSACTSPTLPYNPDINFSSHMHMLKTFISPHTTNALLVLTTSAGKVPLLCGSSAEELRKSLLSAFSSEDYTSYTKVNVLLASVNVSSGWRERLKAIVQTLLTTNSLHCQVLET